MIGYKVLPEAWRRQSRVQPVQQRLLSEVQVDPDSNMGRQGRHFSVPLQLAEISQIIM